MGCGGSLLKRRCFWFMPRQPGRRADVAKYEITQNVQSAAYGDSYNRIGDQDPAAVAKNAAVSTTRIFGKRFQVPQSSRRKPIQAVTPASAASGT